MATLHMSEGELSRDLHAALEKVQNGVEIVIERNNRPLAVLRPAESRHRKLSEIAASLSEHSTAIVDPNFAADVQEFIDTHREPIDSRNWY